MEIAQLILNVFLIPIAALLWNMNNKLSNLKIWVAENYVSKSDLKGLVLGHVSGRES